MRIAVGGVSQETNTFFARPSTQENVVCARGPQLVGAEEWQGMTRAGHEVVPLLHAHVSGAGPISAGCFRGVLDEFISLLKRSLPLDAIFLPLHGAMWVPGIGSGEEALLKAIRGVVGRDVFVAGTLDLHGNMSAEFTRRCDYLTSLRTAPHRDGRENLQRGVAMLRRCLNERIRPVSELIKIPLLLSGEAAMTDYEPAKSFYARLPVLDRRPGILTASLLVGCAWTDGPDTAVSVLIYGTDRNAVRREATQLARDVWDAREQFQIIPPPLEVDDAFRQALNAAEKPVFVSDTGDNTTGGAAGDTPFILKRFLELKQKHKVEPRILIAAIADPEAVSRCWSAGTGVAVDLSLGGKLDQVHGRPFPARAKVVRLVGEVEGLKPRALVKIDGIDVVLSSDNRAFERMRHFDLIGVRPRDYGIIVVKMGYLFPELADFAPKAIMAYTPGCCDLRLESLDYSRIPRPVYPLDRNMRWDP
ncbi:M81 family metallopeptidase, partial [bacterium]|nr:M81 family metallopeptidase [bacterium]